MNRRQRGVVVAGLVVAGLVGPATADARMERVAPPWSPVSVDECDWSSFRNGPRNPGASECTGISATNVGTLAPQLLYRTRDSVTSTPAVVDGVLYVGTWDGWLYAFDADATGMGDPSLAGTPVATVAPLWETQVDDPNGVSFGRVVSSPAVADVGGTRVVVFAGGATVYVLDADDGEVLARACLDPRDHDRCAGSGDHEIEVEASPVVLPERRGTAAIVIGLDVHNSSGVGRTGVVKLRLAHKKARWSLTPEWKYDPESATVLRGDQLLTAGSGTGGGCGGVWGTPAVDVVADLVVFGTASCSRSTAGPDGVPDTGDEDVRGEELFAVRFSDGATVWRYAPPRAHGPHMDDDLGASPQLFEVDGSLVAGIGGKDGWYDALDAETGAPIWRTHVGQSGHLTEGFAIGGILGSPAVGEVGGEPVIFATTAISTPIAAPLDSRSAESADVSLAEDPARMLSLHAIDARSGRVLWRQPLTRQTYGHPTYTNGVVFVPSTAGFSVQAFEASTGVPLWTSPPLNGPPSSGVAVAADAVYVGTGTRQTDAGFKLSGDDSVLPDPLADAVPAPVTDLVGADPQERLAGIWAFRRP